MFEIIELQLRDLRNNLSKLNNTFSITKSAKEFLLLSVKHQEWGARPIRRIIQNLIDSKLSLCVKFNLKFTKFKVGPIIFKLTS